MASLAELEPWLQPYARALLSHIQQQHRRAAVTSAYRSVTEQLELYRNRASNPFPVAPPGRSWHQYRRAFDVSAPASVLEWAGAVWRSWGGTWSISDRIHFQA